MSRTIVAQGEAKDHAATLRNRARLSANRNLLFWYRELYRDQFKEFPDPGALSILEIGSGTDYVDLVFDCHEIDKLHAIEDDSLDVITLTNVLHHLKSPIAFLNCAASKLRHGGKVVATEPFFSVLSTPMFKYLHPEAVDFRVTEPELGEVQGPLASANIALPWLIFFRHCEWLQRLNDNFDVTELAVRPFTALSYMISGGISHRLPVPHFLYRVLFRMDLAISRRFPRSCAAFFTLTLTRR